MPFVLFFFLALCGTENSFAAAHHKGTLSSVNLGTRYSSLLQRRGVIFYRDFQFDPILAVFLFDDRLEYLGDSIGFRDFVYSDKIRLRTRMVQISDNPLFPSYASVKRGNPNRHDTYEFTNSVEFFFPGYNSDYVAELDLSHAKDLNQHHGNYFEAQGKIKLFSYKTLEPNLVVTAGIGDKAHNQYFYGPDDDASGLNNASYGVWIALPEEADRFYPIIQLKHFTTLGDHRQAAFAKKRSDGILFSFIATFGVLDLWRD